MYIPVWVVVGVAIVALFYLKDKNKDSFLPFRIHIVPKWEKLVKDYKIANDDSFFGKIPEGVGYHILRKGVSFTVLKSNLVYRDDWCSFHSEVDFKQRIDELSSGLDFVGFYVKWSGKGYEIGIRTPKTAGKSYMAGDDRDLVKIATLPYSEFGLFKWAHMKKEIRDKILKDFGWTRDEPDAEWSLVDSTVGLEHEYFTVSYRYI